MPDSPIQEDTIPSHPAPEIANEIAAVELNDDTIIFPVIHFDFNNSDIKYSETNKLEEILNTLTSHPDMRVIVKGWCDHTGSISANKRISLQRANSVKKWLVRQGISPSRIESHGMGIDHNECDSSKARRAETSETKNPQ